MSFKLSHGALVAIAAGVGAFATYIATSGSIDATVIASALVAGITAALHTEATPAPATPPA